MGDTTLRGALEAYRSIYMPYRNFAERTREEYTNDLTGFVRFAERAAITKVDELGLPVIHRYVAHLENRGFSGLTRKRKVVAIRTFLLFLYQDEYIGTDLRAKVVLPFAETPAPYVLTVNECAKLRQACAPSTRDAAVVEILLQTGMRLSELTRLTVNDIDWPSGGRVGSIRISSSAGANPRVLPLDISTCLTLRTYLAGRNRAKTAATFVNRFGNPLGERGVEKLVKKHLAAAGIGAANTHTLRHTFGARQMAQGADAKTVQRLMGYKDRRSAEIYRNFSTYPKDRR